MSLATPMRNTKPPFPAQDSAHWAFLQSNLQQLAAMEGIKIEQELAKLPDERQQLDALLNDPSLLRDAVIQEIEADTARCDDDRRTAVETAPAATTRSAAPTVQDDAVSVVLSEKGWIRTRQGRYLDLSALPFKDGDRLRPAIERRSVSPLAMLTNTGRALSMSVAALPDGRGMGAPVTTFIDMPAGAKIVHVLTGQDEEQGLIATSTGVGFTCRFADPLAEKRVDNQFMIMPDGPQSAAFIRQSTW